MIVSVAILFVNLRLVLIRIYFIFLYSERLTGGKVLEEALDSLQDKDSNVSNEELERKIAELESELGWYCNLIWGKPVLSCTYVLLKTEYF